MLSNLSPSSKKKIIPITAGTVVLLFFIIMSMNVDEGSTHEEKSPSIKRVLSDRDTREFGVQELQSRIKLMERDKTTSERKMKRMQEEIRDLRKAAGDSNEIDRKMEQVTSSMSKLTSDIKFLQDQNRDLQDELDNAVRSNLLEKAKSGKKSQKAGANKPSSASDMTPDVENQSHDESDPTAFFASAPTPKAPEENADKKNDATTNAIRVIGAEPTEEELEELNKEEKGLYIPGGSMVAGVLLNGLDAPTKTEASRNPFPSTLRIQHEAILPNYYTADIRECFLIVSGYGDLSSERAYLRGESISCIDDQGRVLEGSIKGYATGEDGKAGVRGRLVSKSGQIIAKALQAGFLEGLSEAFEYDPVPVVQTAGIGDSPLFQQAFSSETVTNGALAGTGKALERIADYYLAMAENIFPVIEVDAGRDVTFILTKGIHLKPKSIGTSLKSEALK